MCDAAKSGQEAPWHMSNAVASHRNAGSGMRAPKEQREGGNMQNRLARFQPTAKASNCTRSNEVDLRTCSSFGEDSKSALLCAYGAEGFLSYRAASSRSSVFACPNQEGICEIFTLHCSSHPDLRDLILACLKPGR